MRRLLLLILCLYAMWTAQGQVAYDWRYWFDQSATYEQGSSDGTLHLDVDVSGLSKTLHQIHLQVRNAAGEFSEPVSKYFFVSDVGHGNNKLHYWFDQNSDALQTIDLTQGMLELNVSALPSGFHTLHFIATDKYGVPSEPMHKGFIRSINTESLNWRYWFDEEENQCVVMPGSTTSTMIDVDALPDGLHYIHLQAMNDKFSEVKTQMFLKVPKMEWLGEMCCLVQIDNMPFSKQTINTENDGIVTLNLDVTSLSQGLHKMDVMVMTPSGVMSQSYSAYFVRGYLTNDRGALRCLYTFDEDTEVHEAAYSDGMSHIDIDVANLENGPHTVRWMLADNEGAYVTDNRSWFIKQPLGGNTISKYSYWLNDADDLKHEYVLDTPKTPFDLITLLPVETMPLRSSCFHFENKNNQPMIYAKNDINFTFSDTFMRETTVSKQYVDYSVGQPVEGIKALTLDEGTEYLAKPQDNAITWYSIECEKGDSLSLKLSQPATVQILTASGEELLNVSGSDAVKMTGARIKANDTYYIAIHDVTASHNTMTMDYLKIGKFTLLATSDRALGCLPYVQIISVEGNGFDNLKTASLKLGSQELTAISISHVTNQSARLYWLFDGNETLGDYDLSLHFDDGDEQRDVVMSNYVTLEKPSFDDITVEISDPRRVADPYPVYIKVTNNSNIAYQAIPFYFAIDNVDRMESVRYMDFAVGCSKELYEAGLQLSFDYDNFQDNGSKTRVVPTIIPELLPGETKTFTLGVKTNSSFNVYAWTSRPWSLIVEETMDYIRDNYSDIQSARGMSRATGAAGIFDGCSDDPCDLAGGIGNILTECVCGTSLALGGTIGGIQLALQNQHNKAMQRAMMGFTDDPNADFPVVPLPSPEDLIWYWLQHCIPGKIGQAVSIFNEGRQMLGDHPCQDPEPHPVTPYNPGDPNEMHGTVSESGSKYIMQDVTDLTYSIEFENDPELANASAHKIVVTNTLDGNIFDLSSFKPTSITIGRKSIELDGSQNSIHTLDMRPEINAIAQIETEFNQSTGLAKWTLSSLDPMTMEETYDIMQGILPVNNGGNGVGFINYEVKLKTKLNDGDTFSNMASIVFDFEDPIETPVWTNTIDAIAPTSRVTDVELQDNDIAAIRVEGNDARSGIWKYDVYVKYGEDTPWVKIGECDTESNSFEFQIYDGIDYGFCALAKDHAGNVEAKELTREIGFIKSTLGDVNNDNAVNILDVLATLSIMKGDVGTYNQSAADANQDGNVNILDVLKILEIMKNQ